MIHLSSLKGLPEGTYYASMAGSSVLTEVVEEVVVALTINLSFIKEAQGKSLHFYIINITFVIVSVPSQSLPPYLGCIHILY